MSVDQERQQVSESTPTTPLSDSASPGRMLVAAREALGLDAAQICARTRLHPAQVKALEENQFHLLPGVTFTRGIIRSYAKAVSIDPQPILEGYEKLMPEGVSPAIYTPTQNIRFQGARTREVSPGWMYGISALALVVGGLAVWAWTSGRVALPVDVFTSAPAQPEAAVVVDAQPAVTPAPDQAPPAAEAPMPAQAMPAQALPPAPATDPATAQPIVAGAGQLKFTFSADSWVEIRDGGGKIAHSALHRGGTDALISAEPPLALTIGNAADVTLVYNGKPVDLAPHVRVTVARLNLE